MAHGKKYIKIFQVATFGSCCKYTTVHRYLHTKMCRFNMSTPRPRLPSTSVLLIIHGHQSIYLGARTLNFLVPAQPVFPSIFVFLYSISSEIPFTLKSARFCEVNFSSYLDLCYVNPSLPQIKDLPSFIRNEIIRSFKKLFPKICPF